MKWNKTNVKPKEHEDVLVFNDAWGYDIADYCDGLWLTDSGLSLIPTHWMELPDPPKKKNGGKK